MITLAPALKRYLLPSAILLASLVVALVPLHFSNAQWGSAEQQACTASGGNYYLNVDCGFMGGGWAGTGYGYSCWICEPPPPCSAYGLAGTQPNCYTPGPSCTPTNCAASTCSGSTCTDTTSSCGSVTSYGTVNCTPPPPTCAGLGYSNGSYPYCWNSVSCSATNSCGQSNYGYTTDYWGSCSVGAPSESGCYVPPTCAQYGQLGTYPYCYTAPTCVYYQGQYCASSNSCGMSSTGTYLCDGSCSVSAPAEYLCPVVPSGTASLSASPATISPGGASTLTYSCTNSYYAELYPSVGTVSPYSGTATVYPSQPTTYTLYCYPTAGGSVTASTIVNISAGPGLPNLTTGSITPTVATEGQSVTLNATVSNSGGATGAAFPNIFQFSGGQIVPAGYVGAIGDYGTGQISYGYTFPSAGTYQLRACADYTSSGAPSNITETSELDNCGPMTTVTVNAPVVPSISCTVNNTNPTVGQTVTYTAQIANGAAAPYTWYTSSGGYFGVNSTASRTFNAAGIYDMQVKADYVSYTTCPFVTVGAAPCNNNGVADIRASQTRVRSGSSVTLTWTASDATAACTVSGPGVSQSSTPAACSVSGTVTTPAITTQSVYTISCPGNVSDTVIVNVLPKIEEF